MRAQTSTLLVLAALWVAGGPVHAAAADDPSRGVEIIETDPPPAGASQAAPVAKPDQTALVAENTAGLALEVLPGAELPIGSKIRFRVSARRPGYLILVDVDAAGKLNQIFPNEAALRMPSALLETFNRIQPGKAVTIPDAGNVFGGFEFVVSEPRGVAMALAILSNQPVQLMDLPDVPAPLTGRPDALKYLTDVARTLRIVRANAAGRADAPKLSFDAKFYVVK